MTFRLPKKWIWSLTRGSRQKSNNSRQNNCRQQLLASLSFFVGHNQGPTNIFDKTCPWASGISKSLAQQSELVVPLNNGRGEAIHLTVAKSIQVIV